MPGPFPGMDPYLESPSIWPEVHQRLVVGIANYLNPQLPGEYATSLGERIYVVQTDRAIFPDVHVSRSPQASVRSASRPSSTAVLEAEPPWVLPLRELEVREPFVEVYIPGSERRVVTVIELLSPANKTAGVKGRDLYLAKQQELLHSDVSLVEVDLLRAGAHTVAADEEQLRERGAWHYLITRFSKTEPWRIGVYPVLLPERLPRISVPLAGGDRDAVVDLQAVFGECYDLGTFERKVDYTREPSPPLPEELQGWADALLRERGLRA